LLYTVEAVFSFITQRSVIQIHPATNGIIEDLEPSTPPGPVADLPIHCNAIQTLLQLNSNNYSSCGKVRYFAVAVFRGEWRRMAVFSGPNSTKRDLLCAELICSAWLSGVHNLFRSRVY